MPKLPLYVALATVLLSACGGEAPASISASPPPPPETSAAPTVPTPSAASTAAPPASGPRACEPGSVNYAAVLEPGTALRAHAGDSETAATLEAGQFLCLVGAPETDAAGVAWEQVVVLPTTLEPACADRPGVCPAPASNEEALVAECRIGATRFTTGCPLGWVQSQDIESYAMGLGGDAAEQPGVENGQPGSEPEATGRERRYGAAAADDRRCEAWVRIGDDELVQTALLRLAQRGAKERTVALPTAESFYQARATHCLVDGDAALVLVQSDSDPSASLNQTVLRIDRVAFDDGRLLASAALPTPDGVRMRWVAESDGFDLRDGVLLLRGLQRGAGEGARDQPFAARFDPSSLAPKEQ